jgi:hypothetical protein
MRGEKKNEFDALGIFSFDLNQDHLIKTFFVLFGPYCH